MILNLFCNFTSLTIKNNSIPMEWIAGIVSLVVVGNEEI